MAYQTDPATDDSDDDSDQRFNITLLAEIESVLQRHGYSKPVEQTERNRATGATLAALLHLTRAFEGEAN